MLRRDRTAAVMKYVAKATRRRRRISQARFFFSVRLAAQRKRGYERRIDDVIPKEQRKRGYERRIDDVIPMDAENAWIWQVETNVNLKKAGIL